MVLSLFTMNFSCFLNDLNLEIWGARFMATRLANDVSDWRNLEIYRLVEVIENGN